MLPVKSSEFETSNRSYLESARRWQLLTGDSLNGVKVITESVDKYRRGNTRRQLSRAGDSEQDFLTLK